MKNLLPGRSIAWAALALLVSVHAASAADGSRPNVLLIYTDDQSYKTVGCEPDAFPYIKTPNIDALAKTGIRFRAAYNGSWCMPSRATILTGRHPHGIESMSMEGVYPGSTYDPAQCPFVPAQMRQQGYQTAQIGKWHTGTDSGFGRDWDYQIVWNRPKYPENAGAYYEAQITEMDGQRQTIQGYPADNYTKWAVDYIKGEHRKQDKPWYLWLCYGSIHGPNTPAERHRGRYKDAEVSPPADIVGPRPGKPSYLEMTQAWTRGPDGRIYAGANDMERVGEADRPKNGKLGTPYDDWVRRVNECVPALDEGVGQVMAALKASGQLDNTLVVFTADQGFAMGEHGMKAKLAPYDANYRSPLIVSMPSRFPTGKVCEARVNGADLVATMLSTTGVKVPWALHGQDLTPLLKNPDQAWSRPCFYEHMGQSYGSDTKLLLERNPSQGGDRNVPPYVAIIADEVKLVRYLEPKYGDELYDLKKDPEELKNVIADGTYREQRDRLNEMLKGEMKRTEAPFAQGLEMRDLRAP